MTSFARSAPSDPAARAGRRDFLHLAALAAVAAAAAPAVLAGAGSAVRLPCRETLDTPPAGEAFAADPGWGG